MTVFGVDANNFRKWFEEVVQVSVLVLLELGVEVGEGALDLPAFFTVVKHFIRVVHFNIQSRELVQVGRVLDLVQLDVLLEVDECEVEQIVDLAEVVESFEVILHGQLAEEVRQFGAQGCT